MRFLGFLVTSVLLILYRGFCYLADGLDPFLLDRIRESR